MRISYKNVVLENIFFAIEKNATQLSYMLQGAGLYNAFASYKFDSDSMKFNAMNDCDMLGYIKKAPYITVTDMAAFRLSSSKSSNQPEFFDDYKELWRKYNEKSGLWKILCDILGGYSEKNDILVSFKKRFHVRRIPRHRNTATLFLLPVTEVLKK